ncbi:MAG: hypothetical protein IJF37_04465 [Lachnospiraceae bacterium]|nr:hypothetical protein [Lachnospiraceae bacterium]
MSKSKRELELEVEVKYLRERIKVTKQFLDNVIAYDSESAKTLGYAAYCLFEVERATDVNLMQAYLDGCR